MCQKLPKNYAKVIITIISGRILRNPKMKNTAFIKKTGQEHLRLKCSFTPPILNKIGIPPPYFTKAEITLSM
jgi:hypothetical protein